MSQAKDFINGEGDAWFNRNVKAVRKGGDNTRKILVDWCTPFKKSISTILEVGAGSGYPLAYMSEKLDAKSEGIEPSKKAVELWNKNKIQIKGGINTNLRVGTANLLPYENKKFDLLVFGFCLYLVDREDLFQSISEADRVLKNNGLLAIIDFDPLKPFKNEYSHKENIFSFKNNYSNIFLASGHYSLMYKHSFSHHDEIFDTDVNERVSLSLLFKEEETIYK